MHAPDPSRLPLDRDRLAAAPLVVAPGWTVEVLDRAESTNLEAAERARAGAPEGLVTFSVVLRPDLPAASWPWLPLVAGQAVRKGLAAIGFLAGLKWPNDVVLTIDGTERKIAGVLVERVDTPQGPAAVVGIGLNVAMTAEELPVPEAGSLALARPDAVPGRTGVLLMLLETLAETYQAWQEGGAAGQERWTASYAAACVTLGRDVAVALPGGETLRGRAESIGGSGELVVREESGGSRAVAAGDVVHVRVP
jgi:BirA family transcriptional regulator, biotin operon repressor / biotin---[acetyl-CoA-carboxylase] ligase